jgi:hypothetical protein
MYFYRFLFDDQEGYTICYSKEQKHLEGFEFDSIVLPENTLIEYCITGRTVLFSDGVHYWMKGTD